MLFLILLENIFPLYFIYFHIFFLEVMLLRKASTNQVVCSKRQNGMCTTGNQEGTSYTSLGHDHNSNTRPSNLNEDLMYVRYSNATNNNIILDENRVNHFSCNNKIYAIMGEKENVSSDEDKFFEGVEKLLEVWFTTQSGNTDHCDLRQIPRWVIQFDSGRKLNTKNGNY